MKKISLNTQILIGAVLGILLGMLLKIIGLEGLGSQILYICNIAGTVFINLLKMILIPLVFTSITVGIANLRAHKQMDRVWKITLIYFISTTALAVFLGMVVVNVFKPGAGLDLAMFQNAMSNFSADQISLAEFISTFFANIFLNPFEAMAQGQVLPTVLFALFLGIVLVKEGDRAKTINHFFNEFFNVIMIMVSWIMYVAPIGIAGLLAKLIAVQDLTLLSALGKFILVVLGATLFHGFISLPLVLWVTTKYHPAQFFAGVKEALITAVSTSSSSATLPITMRCVEDELKVDKDVAGFVLPLGATINMDGTALYEAVAALFVANLVGVDLNLIQQLVVFVTAIIAAIGAPGIPSAGMVTMVMVLQSVGLPAEAIAILLPIDRLLDAVRTMINVEGDAIGSVVVQHFTNKSSR
jgi:Na+/H+-dicarboxylate symporter